MNDQETITLNWQRQPGIDPARVGLLGHSEGGLLALEAADQARNKSHPPAVLVLISTPGRPTHLVLQDQLTRLLKLQGATPEQTRFFLDKNEAVLSAIQATGKIPGDIPPGLAALYPSYLGRFWQEQLSVQPAQLAARYPGPLLVVQGAQDVQVSPEKDAPALVADGGQKRQRKLVIVPGASHNLKIVKEASEEGVAGDIAPEALTALNAWLGVQLER